MDWLAWAIPTVFSLVTGTIAYFAKRSINKRDKEREAKDAKWEQEQREMKELILDQLKTFSTENEKRHKQNEEHICQVEKRLNETLQDMPKVYTLREDWLRFSSNIDRKLEQIHGLLIEIIRGGKRGNEQ